MTHWQAMTPRDRDALVAEHVMGETVDPSSRAWQDGYLNEGTYYTTDHAAARDVEDEIERRGLKQEYLRALIDDVAPIMFQDAYENFRDDAYDGLWAFTRATPEQRCKAALRAIGMDV